MGGALRAAVVPDVPQGAPEVTSLFTMDPGYSQRVETREVVAVAGQRAFFAGWDAYLAAVCILDVTVDGAPAAYAPMSRQTGGTGQAWPQPSTADVARGVYLAAPCAGGEVVAVTYAQRLLGIAPPVPRVTYAPGGVTPDPGAPNAFVRFSYAGPNVPQALVVEAIAGLQVEVWRRSSHAGSVRQSSLGGLNIVRSGRHWSPWWRTPVAGASGSVVIDPFAEGWVAFTSAQRRKFYRLAYFDPATGARSALSDLTLFSAWTGAGDRVNGFLHHPAPSLWVGR